MHAQPVQTALFWVILPQSHKPDPRISSALRVDPILSVCVHYVSA